MLPISRTGWFLPCVQVGLCTSFVRTRSASSRFRFGLSPRSCVNLFKGLCFRGAKTVAIAGHARMNSQRKVLPMHAICDIASQTSGGT